MLSFGLLCQTTGQWSIGLCDLRKSYSEQWILVVIWLVHVLSLLSSHLHKLLVGFIVYNYRFQIRLAWLVVPCQFYWKVSESIAEADLKQNIWKYSDLKNARDRANPAVTHGPIDHDPAHLKVWNKWSFSSFTSVDLKIAWIFNHDFQTNRFFILIGYVMLMLYYISCYIQSDCCCWSI